MRNTTHLTTIAALALAHGAYAQTITPLVLQGDSVPGVGLVTGLVGIAVTDSGEWLAQVSTDNADTNIDGALLKNGVLIQQEGMAVPAPAGALHNEFTSRSMRPNGDVAHIWTLTNTPGGTTDNIGVYVNSTLVFSKGSTPLAAGWGAGTVHNGLSWANLNANNQLLVRGNVTDPTSAPVNDWFISILQLDGAFNPVSENVLARAGQVLPGQTFGVNTVGSTQDAAYFNASGQAVYRVSLTGAPSTADSACYLWNGTTNVLIAMKGGPAPVAGRNWSDLIAPEFAINDAGDYVIKDVMDGATATDGIIAKNGVKYVQEGDPVPGLSPWVFTSFVNTPVSLTNDGRVLWYGDWDNPTTTVDTGIFLDHTMLIQEGVTTVSGAVFTALGNVGTSATAGQNGSMYVSPNGRFVIFTGVLGAPVNKRGIFLLDITGGVTASCFGDGTGTACPCANSGAAGNGCANSSFAIGANMSTSGSPSIANDTLVLTASNIPGPGLFFQGTTGFGGGLGIPFGDGLLCSGGVITRMGVVFPTGTSASYPGGTTPAPIHIAGGTAAGDVRNYQCWYRDAAPFCTPDTFNLTNMVTLTWAN
jgi:hypothetical protein